MTQPSRKRPFTLAALLVAPVLAGSVLTASALTEGAAFALPPPVSAAPPGDVQKAVGLFMKASDLFKAKKYAPALEQFRASYALVPSPNSHLYIARCLALQGDARGAWLEFDRTIDEAAAGGAKYAPTRDSAAQERDDIASKLAVVVVVVQNPDPAMTVRVGAHDLPHDRLGKPFPVEPGNADVVVQVPGKPAVRQPANLAPGERREIALNTVQVAQVATVAPVAPVAPTARRPLDPLRLGAYVAGGVGVVGFALFAAGGVLSKGTYNTLSTACGTQAGCPNPTGITSATVASDISSGKSQQAMANAGLVVGVVGIATGATLFVLSLRRHPSDAARVGDGPRPPAPPTAELTVGPSWAGARGSF